MLPLSNDIAEMTSKTAHSRAFGISRSTYYVTRTIQHFTQILAIDVVLASSDKNVGKRHTSKG
jgi:hypothetical protein